MRSTAFLKHGLSAGILTTLVVGLFRLYSLDVADESFGAHILSGTYFIFLGILLLVYRIDWIGRNRASLLGTLFFIIALILISAMFFLPKNVMALWKFALAAFTLLVAYTFFSKITRNNWSRGVARAFMSLAASFLLNALFTGSGNSILYSIIGYLISGTLIFAILNAILPERSNHSEI